MGEKEIVEGIQKDVDSVLEDLTKLNDSIKDGDSEEMKELKEDLEEVLQALSKGGENDDHRKDLVDEAIQIILAQSKLEHNDQSAQTHDFERLLQWIKDGGKRVSVKPRPLLRPLPTISDDMERDRDHATLRSILKCLPSSSLTDDTAVLKDLQSLTSKSHYARSFLGCDYPEINKLLSQYSGVNNLKSIMATILFNVCIQPQYWSMETDVAKYCPASVSFLVECLSSPKAKAVAAAALSRLATKESNRKIIGESGAMGPLIELVKEGERVGLDHGTKAIWSLCRLEENRERAVSEGVIGVIMEKIRSPTFVNRMLQTLELVCRNERAIGELGETDMLHCLFSILADEGGPVTVTGKENCMVIIHMICHRSAAKTRKVDEVENGRRILESLAKNGTAEAAAKACDLLWDLDFLDLIDRMPNK